MSWASFLNFCHFDDDESGDDNVGDDGGFDHQDMPVDELSFEHHACFAHVIQLIVKYGLKRAGP